MAFRRTCFNTAVAGGRQGVEEHRYEEVRARG